MFLSTPERATLPSIDTMRRPSGGPSFLLPPLSSLLKSDPTVPAFKPTLPSINSFTTPQAPRYIFPSTPASTLASLSTYSTNSKPPISVKTDSVESRQSAASKSFNTSMESDAEITSPNDSMARPLSKRRTSAISPTRDFAFISHSPATYPSQEPSIDNASLARRKRRRTSPNELAVLNQEFVNGQTPDKERRVSIAKKVNMTEKAVQIWFQNKRQSLRRLKSSEKEITVLPPTPDTSTVVSAISTEAAPTPLFESTPIRPSLVKSQSQHFTESPHSQQSPTRSFSTSDLLRRQPVMHQRLEGNVKTSVLSKILASTKDDKKHEESLELVLNLTNKKQPEFARHSPAAANQVRTFKLAPKARKPLASVNTNTIDTRNHKDSQCAQGLLSLKVAQH